jgi:hypothetical protein
MKPAIQGSLFMQCQNSIAEPRLFMEASSKLYCVEKRGEWCNKTCQNRPSILQIEPVLLESELAMSASGLLMPAQFSNQLHQKQ